MKARIRCDQAELSKSENPVAEGFHIDDVALRVNQGVNVTTIDPSPVPPMPA